MKSALLYLVSFLGALSVGSPIQDIAVRNEPTDLPRLIVYFQTTHDSNGRPISMLPLVYEKGIALTHLIVCSLHINLNDQVHLNDYPPGDARFYTLWNETATLRNSGVKIMGMIGGAAAGSFTTSTLDGDDATFEKYYDQVRDVITNFGLQGLDLDVEQNMSQAGVTRLINRLNKDFGNDFLITLAPVASALKNGSNLSGFDYKTLESTSGSKIAWYNGQFYSGFGSMSSPYDYQRVVANGFQPARVVAGQLTAPANGYGYIPTSQLNSTIIQLRNQYGQIGGVMGWEYFNSNPGGSAQPWQWAQIVTQILRPNGVPNLGMTKPHAEHLQKTYVHSWKATGHPSAKAGSKLKPLVNYVDAIKA